MNFTSGFLYLTDGDQNVSSVLKKNDFGTFKWLSNDLKKNTI